jgi:pyruvate dehydrogenase E2 component (dihydrolipoamide acetyltransferase)
MKEAKSEPTKEVQFFLPDLGEGLRSGEICEWLVQVGDNVTVDQPAVLIETAKATIEVPIPFSGKIVELHAQVGEVVPVNFPLLTLLSVKGPTEAKSSITHLVGQKRMPQFGSTGSSKLTKRLPPNDKANLKSVLPFIRRLARELNVDLKNVSGTGKGAAITELDVRRAAKSLKKD